MNDRLAALQAYVPSLTRQKNGDDDNNVDIELGSKNSCNICANDNRGFSWAQEDSSSQPEHMKQFFNHVESIKSDIAAVSSATEQIILLKDKAVLATSENKESNISDEIRTLVETTNKRAQTCKSLLELLKQETANLSKKKDATPSDLRMRENLFSTLLRKFTDEMKRYQHAQQSYKTDVKNKVTRQIQIIKPDATNEEVDEIMRSEGGREALYQQQILSYGTNGHIKSQYRDVADKYQDIVRLEVSVAELQQMFLDLALLTEQQGDMMDQIEYQVKGAANYTDNGNEHIRGAIEELKKSRKKQCWIILIVVVVVFILLFSFA